VDLSKVKQALRRVKKVGFLANDEIPVYKKQIKEKCRLSCN
jgi:hypothetical protein